MGRILSIASRARRSRGFGIHSPFAYDLLKNTLREKLPYYAYEEIEAKMPPHDARLLKLLLRLLCRIKPQRFAATGRLENDAIDLARNALGCEIVPVSGEADMIYIGVTDDFDARLALECVERGGCVMIADIKLTPGVSELLMGNAMTFANRHTFIAVGRRDLPHQHFALNFA